MPEQKTITVYTLAELKELFPAAYDRVHERWKEGCTDIAWTDETMDSLKAIIAACNGSLHDWSIGAYSQSNRVRVSVPDEYTQEWFLHNVLKPNGYIRKNGHAYFPGNCAFTGYCADDDFLEATWKALNNGDTLTEALQGLADVAGKMFEDNLEQEQDDESMEANWGENTYDENGDEI